MSRHAIRDRVMLSVLESTLGYTFRDIELLDNALNRTYRNRDGSGKPDFEHMEVVGDSLIGAFVKSQLSRLHPDWTPGQFQEVSIKFLRNADEEAPHGSSLYRIAKFLMIENLILLNPGEDLSRFGARGKSAGTKKKTREHKLVDHVEAIIGAIHIDCGYEFPPVFTVLSELFRPLGLEALDLRSATEYGASHTLFSSAHRASSHSASDDEEVTTAMGGMAVAETAGVMDYSRLNTSERLFIEHAGAGHLGDMMKIEQRHLSIETFQKALIEATSHQKSNVVGWLFTQTIAWEIPILEDALTKADSTRGEIFGPIQRALQAAKKAKKPAEMSGGSGGASTTPVPGFK